jgi:hypothetical protein
MKALRCQNPRIVNCIPIIELTILCLISRVVVVITPGRLLIITGRFSFFNRDGLWNGLTVAERIDVQVFGHPYLGANGDCFLGGQRG